MLQHKLHIMARSSLLSNEMDIEPILIENYEDFLNSKINVTFWQGNIIMFKKADCIVNCTDASLSNSGNRKRKSFIF